MVLLRSTICCFSYFFTRIGVMQKIYYATGNPGKFHEISSYATKYFTDVRIEQYDCELTEIQTLDQQEIAIHKAQQAYELLKHPVLVDDSGIFFHKYHQFPGTLSKFIHKSIGFEGILKLVDQGDKAAFFLTMVYYYGPNQYICFEGRSEGIINYDTSFKAPPTLPYDVLFSPQDTGKTYAELRSHDSFDEYNVRTQAFKKFVEWYRTQATL